MNLMNDEKHFNTLSNYYKTKYGKKVFKISLNGNFKCPHSGCIFCNGSGDYAGDKNKSIKDQFDDIKNMMEKKWDDAYYIVYFQANTNTFAPLSELKAKYEEALSLSDKIIGISIATRCDSISDECLEYLTELNKRTFVQIELGLQTIHEKTSTLINRGHTLEQFDECIKRLKKANLSTVVHIINGLPYESEEMMIETAKYVGKLGVDGIKIHMLYVMKNTKLLDMYNKEKFHILTRDEYVKIVSTQLEYLPLSMIIHRLTGDSAKDLLVEPLWSLKKFVVLNEIDKYMRKNNIYQGDKFKED